MIFPYEMMEQVWVSTTERSKPKGVTVKSRGCKLGRVVYWQRYQKAKGIQKVGHKTRAICTKQVFHLPNCMCYLKTGVNRQCWYKCSWNVLRNVKTFRISEVAYEPLQRAPHPQTLVISVQITAIVCMQFQNRLQLKTLLYSTAKIKLLFIVYI